MASYGTLGGISRHLRVPWLRITVRCCYSAVGLEKRLGYCEGYSLSGILWNVLCLWWIFVEVYHLQYPAQGWFHMHPKCLLPGVDWMYKMLCAQANASFLVWTTDLAFSFFFFSVLLCKVWFTCVVDLLKRLGASANPALLLHTITLLYFGITVGAAELGV